MGSSIGLSYLPEKKLITMADYIGTNFYIKPTYIVALPEYSGPSFGRSFRQRESEKNLKTNSPGGNMSAKSSRKLMNAVNWLVSSAKSKSLYSKKHKKYFQFKINFITLTFPYEENKPVPEKQAKRCIHAFLSYSRKYFYLRNYIWKFEKTQKGQLHIHLTTDTFIDYRRLRKQWNRILQNEMLLNRYFEQTGHFNANSTDVHAVHKVKDVAAYIAKYMSKSAEKMSEFKGRIWACNREISEANSCREFLSRQSNDISNKYFMAPATRFKPILSPPDAFGRNKQIGEIYFMNEKAWQKLNLSLLRERYDDHRFHIRNNIEQLPVEYYQSFVDDFFGGNLKSNEKTKILEPSKEIIRDGGLHDATRRLGKRTNNQLAADLCFETVHDS